MQPSPGIVYILSNPAMPNIIKLGITTQEDVKLRMAQLYSTGVPLPFECVYAAKVSNFEKVEKALHTAFGPDRVNPKREFFWDRCQPSYRHPETNGTPRRNAASGE